MNTAIDWNGSGVKGEEVVRTDRLLVLAPQVQHVAADQRAERPPDAHAPGHGPQHVDRRPAPPVRAQPVEAEQPEPSMTKGKAVPSLRPRPSG